MSDDKLTPDQLRAWLDRPPPPRELDTELANRPPEEWELPPLEPEESFDVQMEAGHA